MFISWIHFLILYIIFHLNFSASNFFDTEISNDNYDYLCIIKLFAQFKNPFTLFIYNINISKEEIWDNISPKTILSSMEKSTKHINKICYTHIIMILDSITCLNNWLNHLRKSPVWNSRARFIINIKNNENMTAIFELTWSYYIININVITNNNNKAEVYTYFPYNNNNCAINFNSSLLLSCENKLTSSTFPNKVPRQFSGCDAKIMAYKIPPYMMKTTSKYYDPNSVGIEITMLHTIAMWLNFTEKYLAHNFTYWGVKFPNKTYSNIYNDLYNRYTDMMVGMVPMDIHYMDDFDNTVVYLIEGLVWWVPSAKQLPRWENIAKIYQPIVWLFILLSFVMNCLLWWVLGRKKETSGLFINLTGNSLGSWYVMLQGSIRFPKSMVMRIIYISWVFFTLLIYAAFQSKLVSVLTKPQYEHQISNVKELIASKLSFGFIPSLTRFFSDPNSEIDKYILNNYIVCPLTEECLNRSAFNGDFAVMKNKRPPIYNMKKMYMSKDGRRLIYGFKDYIMVFPHIVFSKGHPLFDKVNDVILRMQNAGFLAKWEADISHAKEYPEDYLEPLAFDNLTIAFLTLTFGFSLTVLVCLSEIIYYKLFQSIEFIAH